MIVLGIDPGVNGGLAWLNEETSAVQSMPETPHEIFEALRCLKPDHVFIEKVGAMPGNGVASMWKFGFSVGVLHGILTALEIPYDEVTPGKWMRALSCLTKGDKAVTRRRAQQLYPSLPVTNKTADALLIALYGQRKLKGTL